MDVITILNSAPVGVLLGIVVTKTFDILNKRVEYKQDAKKILYNKKLEVGEMSIQYLHAYYEQLHTISLTIAQALEDESINEKLFIEIWTNSHGKLEKMSDSTMEMFGKTFLYFNINIDDFHLIEKNNEFLKNVSNLLNLAESEDKQNYRKILTNYNSSLEILMDRYKELINIIIEESKTN
jgi:hypothetical protein